MFRQSRARVTLAPPDMERLDVTSLSVRPAPREMQNQLFACLTTPPKMSSRVDFCVRDPTQQMPARAFVWPGAPITTRPSLTVKTA